MRMGGFEFAESDLQAEYQKTMPKTVMRLLWGTRYAGLEKGWASIDLKKRLNKLARVLQRQVHPNNKMSDESLDRLLDF